MSELVATLQAADRTLVLMKKQLCHANTLIDGLREKTPQFEMLSSRTPADNWKIPIRTRHFSSRSVSKHCTADTKRACVTLSWLRPNRQGSSNVLLTCLQLLMLSSPHSSVKESAIWMASLLCWLNNCTEGSYLNASLKSQLPPSPMVRYKGSISWHVTFMCYRLYAASPVTGTKLCFQPVPEFTPPTLRIHCRFCWTTALAISGK